MNKIILILVLAVMAAAQSKAPSGDAARGKEMYVKYTCYACHSFDGHGGAGARLVPMKMLLPVFTAYVRAPRQMPAYREKVMSDSDLADVYAYIKSIPESPAAKSIPLLSQLPQ
ncbi:MAG TPA: cytochrome c [Bryobacteraceae bacterium]|nr:cytochrome c [Bryobacteraceae bacterium]